MIAYQKSIFPHVFLFDLHCLPSVNQSSTMSLTMHNASSDETEIIMRNRIKRIWLSFQIYSLDITISGQKECIEMACDPSLKSKIEDARSNACSERERLLSAYYDTFAPVSVATRRVA